jgi:hypothetical protein
MKRLSALLLIAIVSTPLAAQTQTDSIPQILEKVDSGSMLRVRAGRQMTRGRFSGMSNDAIVLEQTSGAQTPIRFSVIDDIWKGGSYWKQGAIIGGVASAAVLTGFGFLIVKASCEQDDGCKGDYPIVALYAIGVGGVGGGLVGAGLGYLAKRWVPIFSN